MNRAAIKTSAPAGTRRVVARNKGAVSGMTPFIATIAVPHRKKGAIRRGIVSIGLLLVGRFVSIRQAIAE
jgi:hypothetical protein